jgi:hypothetical protein
MNNRTPDRLMMHFDWDVTGYPVFYVHGLAGEGKRDRNKLDAMLVLFEAAPELLDALKALAEHMDRAGGDRDGMPECPWCKSGGPDGDEHAGNCELVAARAAIAKAEGR